MTVYATHKAEVYEELRDLFTTTISTKSGIFFIEYNIHICNT